MEKTFYVYSIRLKFRDFDWETWVQSVMWNDKEICTRQLNVSVDYFKQKGYKVGRTFIRTIKF